ncbi:MAG TPA: response regulator [Verrucomicrobiae bacterium]|nr:response regulator [Verrucomicrobiae bacterium]
MNNVILLAEDSEDDALYFKRVLESVGVCNPVQVVTDGLETIAYLKGEGKYADRARYPFPSVLFLDLLMPRVDGWFVLKWLSGEHLLNKVTVIVITGVAEHMVLQSAYSMGAHSFIFKPFQAEELNCLIKYWPELWALKPARVDAPAGGSRR